MEILFPWRMRIPTELITTRSVKGACGKKDGDKFFWHADKFALLNFMGETFSWMWKFRVKEGLAFKFYNLDWRNEEGHNWTVVKLVALV